MYLKFIYYWRLLYHKIIMKSSVYAYFFRKYKYMYAYICMHTLIFPKIQFTSGIYVFSPGKVEKQAEKFRRNFCILFKLCINMPI